MSREESLSIENLIWRLYSILVSLCLATMLSRLLLCITSQKKLKSSLKQIFEAKPKWLKKKHFYGCIGAVKHLFTASLFSLEMKEKQFSDRYYILIKRATELNCFFCSRSIFKKWYFVTRIVLTYCEEKMF